ncbi:YeeE/YedE family protein [Litorisediminicola beolgyonensis]|uniref:YeeE/YedE family protein n=1 Tax=Litorisediminicola beolgyonensis TaxID=1173614 RepID=A0ABW3ZIE2_9RHOB
MPLDYLYGLGGGLLIGIAASLFLLGNGRIMGASGLIGALIDGSGRRDAGERLLFLLGLAGAPALLALIFAPEITHLTTAVWALVVAGLSVGIGTRMANGCTSGHGVCGISRLSPRGIVATLIYLVSGGVTLVVFRHLLGVI